MRPSESTPVREDPVSKAMECFNTLLLKLREVHEREVEGWQLKIQELSNKKGCDTKRMEELFSKNQQMKEQQRILTDNIKTLENRLRAGLCDRCTVTQEVAKRKQHEFEASQMQSFQHISLLAGEVNNMKKENKRLKDEIKTLRAALHGPPTDLKRNRSPDPSGAVALLTSAASRASSQPADANVAMKPEEEQWTEDGGQSQWRGVSRKYFAKDSYKPFLATSAWKAEPSGTYNGERRVQVVDGLEQQSCPVSPHTILKSPLSSSEVNHSRHLLHAPVPCRPQPIKSNPVVLQWASPPPANQLLKPSSKSHLLHFSSATPSGQHDNNPKRPGFGHAWHKQSVPKSTEPTVLFRLKSLSEHVGGQSKHHATKESSPVLLEKVCEDGAREMLDGPLDLSDRGKSKSSQSPTEFLPTSSETEPSSPDKDVKANPFTYGSPSPHSGVSPSSSPRPTAKQYEGEPEGKNQTKMVKEQNQTEEVNGKTERSGEEKVSALTLSLHPAVVVLESLNSALQKQEFLTANDKSPLPTTETESSTDEQEHMQHSPAEESQQSSKRKRTPVDIGSDEDLDIDGIQQEKKLKIPVRAEDKSSNLI